MELSFQHPRSGEWAHDCRDPLREARCTFVEPILETFELDDMAAAGRPLRILEIGFGRGLNTAMALRILADKYTDRRCGSQVGNGTKDRESQADAPVQVQAWGCEPNPHFVANWPPPPAEIAPFAPWWGYAKAGDWTVEQPSSLIKIRQTTAAELLAELPADSIDWIFLDLFSPAKHGEDWQPELWAGLAKVASPQAVLTSYCCARRVRDGLQNVGWHCEVLRRPGCRDTLRARFLAPGDRNA
jgi:tRNA 5-methylaminomethyl-2-thiouridine biosynthesis bifunctional protein